MGCEPLKTNQKEQITEINRRLIKKFSLNFQASIDHQSTQNIIKNNLKPSTEDLANLQKVFSSHFFFYKLRKNQIYQLIDSLMGYSAKKDNIIFYKGDNPNFFFYIKSGVVSVDIEDGNPPKSLKQGDYFGQLALLYKAPRSATIRAQQECQFFCLQHKTFRKIMQQITIQNFSKVKSHVEKAPIFKYLTERQKVTISYNTHTLKYQNDEVIFKQGDDANSFYIITKGNVKINIPNKDPIIMSPGQSFGQNSFQQRSIRGGTAIAEGKVSVLSIGRESLKKCIGGFLQQMSFINIMKWSMVRHSYLKYLTDLQRQRLISCADIVEYNDQQTIQQAGRKPSKFYICLQQCINGEGTGSIHCFEQIFGDSDEKILKTVKKQGKGKIGIFDYKKVKKIIGKNLNRTFQEPLSICNNNQKKKDYYNNLNLQKLKIKHQLGSGLFGKVFCVEDDLKIQYALKCISKRKIIKNQMEKFIVLQKKILEKVQSPFIVKLYKTLYNEDHIFFLMKYIDGGDFFRILRNIGICTKQQSRFYFGSLLLAIQHLHKNNIIYRDIKPQNTVVDKSGFLHLVDLGTAKYLQQKNGFKTFTIVGTPHYMAPEIIHGQGYSFSVDLWSMGVFFYEMVCGQLPYGNQAQDPYEVFRQIEQSENLRIPNHYTDITGIVLVEKLLSRDQRQRQVQDFSRIKNMAYFQDFNWEQLQKKNMESPFAINRQKLNIKIERNLLTYLKYLQQKQEKDKTQEQKNIKDDKDSQETKIISQNAQWNETFQKKVLI